MNYDLKQTLLGNIIFFENDSEIQGIWFDNQKHFNGIQNNWIKGRTALIEEAMNQFDRYLSGHLNRFDLPLSPQGTEFQKKVWSALMDISFGEVMSYGQVAKKINQANSARAVGAAIGRNPISVIIPCHRVLSSQHQLTGYAGGLERKKWLLSHEKGMALSRLNYQE